MIVRRHEGECNPEGTIAPGSEEHIVLIPTQSTIRDRSVRNRAALLVLFYMATSTAKKLQMVYQVHTHFLNQYGNMNIRVACNQVVPKVFTENHRHGDTR